jgi:hypothetical protein
MANTPTPGLADANLLRDSVYAEENLKDNQEQTGNIPTESAAVTVGKNRYTPTQTEDILANMQKYIDERESPFAKFAGGLSAGMATARGPTTLAIYQKQKQEEDKQIMDYRQQMAQLASAPELARQRNLSMAQMLASLKGEGTGAVGTGVASSGLDPNILNRVAQLFPVDEEKANQLLNSHLLETSKINRTAALSKDFYSPDIQIAAPTPENPKATRFVSVADIQSMPIMPRLTAQGQATLAQKNASGVSAPPPSAEKITGAQRGNAVEIASNLGIPLISGDRDWDKQYNLYQESLKPGYKGNPVAFPGTSKHETGNAIDTLRKLPDADRQKLIDAGFKQVDPKDPGHWELPTTSTVKPTETTAIKTIQTPIPPPAALVPPSIGLLAEQKAAGEKAKVAAGETAKTAEAERKEFKTNINPDTLVETDAMAKRVQTLVKKFPEISGVINKNDYASAVAGVLKDGIGPASIKGIETAIFKTLPTTDKDTLAARNELATYLARIELQAAKLIKGQGQITEGEREILGRASATLDDPAELLYKKARIIERANKKNEALSEIYGAGKKFPDFEEFSQDKEFKRIMKEYKTDLNNIMDEKVDFRKLKIGAQPGKIEHPSDIQDIINRTQKLKKAE